MNCLHASVKPSVIIIKCVCRYSVRENLVLDDVSVCKQELDTYRTCGGGTVCEMSVIGMRRKNHAPQDLVEGSCRNISLYRFECSLCYWILPGCAAARVGGVIVCA